MPINIVIANKQTLTRDVLKYRLEVDNDIKIVGDTDNGFECLNLVNKLKPNVLILDTELNSFDGLKVLNLMKEQGLYNKVLFLSDNDDSKIVRKALDIGCDGYVTKDIDYNEFKKAIYSVYKGDRYIQSNLKEILKEPISGGSSGDKVMTLTKRELEILKLIAAGLTNKEISAHFDISDRTVKNHIFSIFKKIQVSDRTQAAVYAIRNGIVDVQKW